MALKKSFVPKKDKFMGSSNSFITADSRERCRKLKYIKYADKARVFRCTLHFLSSIKY